MYRTPLALLLACTLVACGPSPRPKVVAITEVGAAMGTPVTQMIGPSGGTLSSPDGQLTVTIPANAVSAMTAFSVVPIETKSPGGLRSYRLGPEGTTFTTPAKLTFKYGPEDVAGSDPAVLSIVFQDAEKKWRRSATTLDTEAKTLTTETTHFSDWSAVRGANLFPPTATVRVGQTTGFEVKICDFNPDEDLAPVGYECQSYDTNLPPVLRGPHVEGILGGNAALGTVTTGPKFMYRAPSKKPTPNPVAVSVEVPQFETAKIGKVILLSSVTVKDDKDPEIDFPSSFTGSGNLSRTVTGLSYSGSFSLTGGRTDGLNTPNEYSFTGQFNVTSGTFETADCNCTITGGSSAAEGGLILDQPTMTHTVTVSAYVTAPLSCMKSKPSATCPSTTILAIAWGSPGDSTCSGSTSTSLTSLYAASGNFSRTCGSSSATSVSWSFVGAK